MEQQIAAIKSRISMISQASEKYHSQEKIIGRDAYHKLKEFSSNFEADALSIIENNRKLKIGVVGQIKAGKSSFLNSLLFDGKDLLPKAATPMTAALTVISYAEEPKAEIEFYTNDEWLLIIDKAQKYEQLIEQKRIEISQGGNKFAKFRRVASAVTEQRTLSFDELKALVQAPDDIKTAHELYTMARKSSISIQAYLGDIKTIDHVKGTSELIGELQQYVGAEGAYTPIVKSTKVFINNEVLKTIDVVDTPGINDPIISRGQRTREYLGKCDVVFLLSYSGQFMDSVDVELLTQNIPDKGIVNVILVGSKFDSVLQDIGGSSLGSSLAIANRKLNDQAKNTIMPILNQFPDNKVLQSLKESLPPIFISSMAYNIANEFPALNREQQHIFSRLQATFPNDRLTPELLKDLSNIDRIKNTEMPKVVENKEKILNERFENLLSAQNTAFIKEMTSIKDELEKDLNRLLHSSGEDLENHFKKIDRGINQARKKVDLVFSRNMLEMEKGFGKLKSDFKESAIRYRKFNENTETKREKVGEERYGFLWLKKRNVYENRTYTSANVHQSIDNIESLVLELDKKIKQDFDTIIRMDKLTIDLKDAVKGIFDLGDESFDFEDVIIPVEKTVNKISIPQFEVDSEKYREKIIKKFGLGKVEGGDVNKLREMQYTQIDEIIKDTDKNITSTVANVQAVFNKVSSEFIDDVLKESQQKKFKLQEELKNLKETRVQYEQVMQELNFDIQQLVDNGDQAFRPVKEWKLTKSTAANQAINSAEVNHAIQQVGAALKEASSTVEQVVNFNRVKLVQGQKIGVPSQSTYTAKISYQASANIELDLSAFVVQQTGKVSGDQDFIFYNQPTHPSDSLTYSGNGMDQMIAVDLQKVPANLAKVVFTLTIGMSQLHQANFSQVKGLTLHVFENGNERFTYPVSTPFVKETGIVLGEIYRYKNEWKLGTVGNGFNNGLKGLCDLFGVDAD
ncbi:TerD family protein [Neobacillus niacini]|uniref:TerD family protein n=1 Tax=Neobacillus niacini TaxID=86668 RepID=UPI0030007080